MNNNHPSTAPIQTAFTAPLTPRSQRHSHRDVGYRPEFGRADSGVNNNKNTSIRSHLEGPASARRPIARLLLLWWCGCSSWLLLHLRLTAAHGTRNCDRERGCGSPQALRALAAVLHPQRQCTPRFQLHSSRTHSAIHTAMVSALRTLAPRCCSHLWQPHRALAREAQPRHSHPTRTPPRKRPITHGQSQPRLRPRIPQAFRTLAALQIKTSIHTSMHSHINAHTPHHPTVHTPSLHTSSVHTPQAFRTLAAVLLLAQLQFEQDGEEHSKVAQASLGMLEQVL